MMRWRFDHWMRALHRSAQDEKVSRDLCAAIFRLFYWKMIHVDLKQTFCSPDSMNYSMTIPHSREPIDAIKKRWAIFLTIISIAMTTCNFRYRPKLHQLLYSIEIVASSRWGCVIKGGQSNEIWDFFHTQWVFKDALPSKWACNSDNLEKITNSRHHYGKVKIALKLLSFKRVQIAQMW